MTPSRVSPVGHRLSASAASGDAADPTGSAEWRGLRALRRVQRRGFLGGSGELFQPACRVVELVAIDVRVARDGREVGVAEVLGDEAGVAALLPKPGRGGVAQCVGGGCFSSPARTAARRMMSARIVSCFEATPGDRAGRFHGDRSQPAAGRV